MKFKVVWRPLAERNLARLWVESDHRRLLADAANRLDAAMAERGDTFGESRSGSMRVAFSTPLGVLFEVAPEEGVVYVANVWAFGQTGPST